MLLSEACGPQNSCHTPDHSSINHEHEQDYSENTDIKEVTKWVSLSTGTRITDFNLIQGTIHKLYLAQWAKKY